MFTHLPVYTWQHLGINVVAAAAAVVVVVVIAEAAVVVIDRWGEEGKEERWDVLQEPVAMESSVIFCLDGRVVEGGGNQSMGLQWSIVILGV